MRLSMLLSIISGMFWGALMGMYILSPWTAIPMLIIISWILGTLGKKYNF